MTLSGVWQNEYGSIMDLSVLSGGLVFGTYSSSTGSTGKYCVIGFQQSAEPTTAAGQAVALAIEWHSIAGGAGDPSWNWSSGLSGQLSLENGKESLVLAHAMVASSAFPGLCAAGTYIDKLTYSRVSDASQSSHERPAQAAAVADPMAGTWSTADGSTVLTLRVYPYTNNLFGWVMGSLSTGGTVCQIEGVTDINATSSGLTLQSTALTAVQNAQSGPAIAFAGCLDLRTGILTLLKLSSLSTAPDATYVQTTVDQLTLRRITADTSGK
ncbi:avidin/streptavidin family protein [Sphingomonas sp. MMS24-J45]|uniref:avidin/streptavidin family protein n=1 Tax=Sphingomonas sp. MMS24-J45 TaxID=3238806 RepID=UPI00384B12BB